MRKLIESDALDEPVKRFLDGLEIAGEPSIVELGGRRVYIVVRRAENGATQVPWEDSRAIRRHELVDRKLDAALSPSEALELAELNEGFDRHLHRTAPLPIAHARELLARIELDRSAARRG